MLNARLIRPSAPGTDSNISIHFFLRYQFLYAIYKSYQLFCYVLNQVRILSQVGTKEILKGGWAILELFEPCRNHDSSFVLKVVKRGFSPSIGSGLALLGVLLNSFEKESTLMNLCNVNGKISDLKRYHPTQSEYTT